MRSGDLRSGDLRSDMRLSGFGGPILMIAAALLVALLAVATHVRSAYAEGAIAMGQTDTVGTDGLAFGAHYNDFEPNRIVGQATAECRTSAASERAQNACTVIGTFHDRCFSLAQDSKLTPHGVGLSLAETRKSADALATDQCRKMAGSAHAKTCAVLRNGCDGEAAFRGDPIDATGFNDRAFAYLNKRDYDHAAADFGMVIKFDPQNVAAYNDRAAAYKLKGDFDRALAITTRRSLWIPNMPTPTTIAARFTSRGKNSILPSPISIRRLRCRRTH